MGNDRDHMQKSHLVTVDVAIALIRYLGFPTILTQRWPHAIGADVHLSKVARYVCVDSISLSGKI